MVCVCLTFCVCVSEQAGTQVERLVNQLIIAVSPYMDTEEILIDEASRKLHAIVVNSAEGGAVILYNLDSLNTRCL